ncbi:MAG: gliding motility-associated-like protein, partial [Psychromonas sp.]
RVDYSNLSPSYSNYYLGNSNENWKSKIHSSQKSTIQEVYPGIDFQLNSSDNKFEYTFKISPFSNPNKLRFNIEGADSLRILDNGDLRIYHRFGFINQSAPKAFQKTEKGQNQVDVEFKLNKNILFFEVGEYNPKLELIIDPDLTFSTYTGSTADNWGSTATPDSDGNVYAGGVAFGQGYPVTTGAYDGTFNNPAGGNPNFDVTVSKFSKDGSALLYSTYIGGSGNEFPSSMFCDQNGVLNILGITGSTNFPVPNGVYSIFSGGAYVSSYGLTFDNGTDIFVNQLSADGTAMLSGSYIGGSSNDGINLGILNYNLGDTYRGEIIVDTLGFVYVASSTRSIDFPTVGAISTNLTGSQNAAVFKFSPGLATLEWSRYFGGESLDAGMALQVDSTGDLYLTGGTCSQNLPFPSGAQSSYGGGQSDGYIVKLEKNNGAILAGTYIGMSTYDQSYFVQIDLQENVYVLGQTDGNYPITPGKFGVPNSGQFIRKFSNDLSSVLWTTMIGGGGGGAEISPTAFLVSDCFDVYVSGWGGALNNANGQMTTSSTNNFPVTSDAYQPTTNGHNFYLAVLTNDAVNLKYATFMGGLVGNNRHVDGGTSRFDKKGRVYHAVCAGCGGNSDGFNVTPGVWSETNNSSNCNLGVFKFDLGVVRGLASGPSSLICFPDPVMFDNQTQNGNQFYWDFGDGETSDQVNPAHDYPGSGTYEVTFVVSDSNNCYTPDTTIFTIEIGDFNGVITDPTDTICPNDPTQLFSSGGQNYKWIPAQFLDDANIENPIAIIDTTTEFTVVITDSCGVDTFSLILHVYYDDISVSENTSICRTFSTPLSASGGDFYSWTPVESLDDPTSPNPTATPDSSTLYTVEIRTNEVCVYYDSTNVVVFNGIPVPVIDDTVFVCENSSITIEVSGAEDYFWLPNPTLNTTEGPTVIANPTQNTWYYCDFTNACGSIRDSVFVRIDIPVVTTDPDTSVCLNDTVSLYAQGGVSYTWQPNYLLIDGNSDSPKYPVVKSQVFTVIGTDSLGCLDTAYQRVSLLSLPKIETQPIHYAVSGDIITLTANGFPEGGDYEWSPTEYLSCPTCMTTLANPNVNSTYQVEYTDFAGCKNVRQVQLIYEPIVYIPNVFTPDFNTHNPVFSISTKNVASFELVIYTRWGELIKTMDLDNNSWDGTYKDKEAPEGLYIWKINFKDFKGQVYLQSGHVNVLR